MEPDVTPSKTVPPVRSHPTFDPLGGGDLAQVVRSIAEAARAAGGRALVVGGAVRDAIIAERAGVGRVEAEDIDLEVYGIDAAVVHDLVAQHGDVDTLGESFAVFKLRGRDLEVSLPRAEERSGSGHRGALVNADPSVPPERAALRRDFTINAMLWDPLDSVLIDPCGGVKDTHTRTLRHLGPAFADDPLRVLRGAQLISRFALMAAPGTVAMCRGLLPRAAGLARERVAGEWAKLLLLGRRPGDGLRFLDACGWIEATPGLAALRGVEQDPLWHPEGDVFVHTAHVMDAWAELRPDGRDDALVTGLASLCHDLGKPATTAYVDGRWQAHGHEAAGVAPARELLELITIRTDLARQVTPLVENHLAPSAFHRQPRAGRPAIRRLANRVGGRLDRLVLVAHADQAGRPPLVVDRFDAGEWLLQMARHLDVERSTVEPFLRGRDLIDLGLRPGKVIGAVLAEVLEAQIDEIVTTHAEAVDLARSIAVRDELLTSVPLDE